MSVSIPTTRAARQARIIAVVETTTVSSQGQLRRLLQEQGIAVTQATLSRDLEELRAYKEHNSAGQRVYRIPAVNDLAVADNGVRAQLNRWARELLVSAQHAENQIVLRTPPGAAQLLASSLDRAVIDGVLGCIAGDDTVLVITASAERAVELKGELLDTAHARSTEDAS
ncbi:arginine repressor [Arcanobacterium haemolyticum]|uniref:Arginine repressor n=1 Tax=Arcanobacterium haemolyticum (strain ATCC 9345 / DSM 20595 / CCM 5947 / CCUG 17215 / LMG 16163 / NBRC 15585 / NCTC 8452 / 11018) TaxID=644284 RepID=D7BP26_ARCHD|nr:arginine repressor [Arcanobacterium haemolyticum]ADH92675.1 arginine repressor, ArgR [Arcanobacterium haemolyticum DSM 20595]QCX46785.1 arginine repressor [Arcanobacterium haemolyticum]SPT74812.1 Arginine repressor [Arcanobacterium haemolyticum]SQH28588.1 Arginine repressor [Arcanobacterium haemolyticum]